MVFESSALIMDLPFELRLGLMSSLRSAPTIGETLYVPRGGTDNRHRSLVLRTVADAWNTQRGTRAFVTLMETGSLWNAFIVATGARALLRMFT